MNGKVTLAPYDITGKSEIEVQAEVWSRITKLNQSKEPGQSAFDLIGADTLFYIVSDAYLAYSKQGVEAATAHIKKQFTSYLLHKRGIMGWGQHKTLYNTGKCKRA